MRTPIPANVRSGNSTIGGFPMQTLRGQARGLVTLGPASNDHLAALRVGLSVAVPSLVLLAAGRPELIIYAVFGAFTGMYGRAEGHQLRLRHQGQAAAVLVTGVSIGVFLSVLHVQSWALIAIGAVLAGVGSLVTDHAGLKPGGPFFGIFALGACASVPAVVSPWVAIAICAASAAFSMLIGFAGWVRSREWESGASREVPALRLNAALVHAGAYVVAVGAGGTLAAFVGMGFAPWAMAAAAVPLAAADIPSRVHRGIHRCLGTFAGLVVTAGVLFLRPGSTLLAVFVVVLQFPAELFIARHYALALVFFTPLVLLMIQLAHPGDPLTLVTHTAVDTLIGALVGITVVLTIRTPHPAATS